MRWKCSIRFGVSKANEINQKIGVREGEECITAIQ